MSTDEFLTLFGARDAHEPRDPMKAAQVGMRASLPRRFYAAAAVAPVSARPEAWQLLLDGRPARTPGRNPLAAPNQTVAAALAAEWNAQIEVIDPATMPLTRLLNAAIDGVAGQAEAVRAEIVRYAGSDLICYRADTPQELAEAQAEAWDPLVAWARDALGAPLVLGSGVIHVPQPGIAIEAVAAAVATVPAPAPLAALSMVTSLGGSAVVALALATGRLDADGAWLAAHVDENYQEKVWGADDEAALRQANRRRDFDAAALVLASVRRDDGRGD